MVRTAITAALVTFIAASASAQIPDAQATYDVVVANGPRAGTYKLASLAPCYLAEGMPVSFARIVEAQYEESAAASQRALKDPKALNAVILTLYDWKGSGTAKEGVVKLIFGPMKDGDAAAGSTSYEVNTYRKSPNGRGTFTGAISPTEARVTFAGQTAKGIKIRVVMHCTDPIPM